MLTPETICRLVEHDLQTYVNRELRTNRESLYAGNTIVLYFNSEKEHEWVCNHLNGFTIERKKICAKHEHGSLCFNSEAFDHDSDEEETGTDDQTGKPVFCAHANGTCSCPKFIVYVKL